ncbi:cation diffusion facilitator family transporter [Hominifimenecus sp. rT4P-3]|uniref:cation diffusion facilitator family transporter n=1 Tax=Hominifimenecus sp. rT4P-3 TaxID=3242979 RepID=UPI003DA585B0
MKKRTDRSSLEMKLAMRVSTVSIVGNLLLSVGKLAAGLLAHSGAMVSDAVHSASDVFSTLIVILGFKLSRKKADEDHPYGHERLECVAAILLAVALFATGIGIGWKGLSTILSKDYSNLAVPGALALAAAVLSIVVKEWMYWYTRRAAKKIHSDALMADAWHHRSDALSSVGALVGIAGARMGYPIMDSVASVVICIFIFKVAIDVFHGAIDKMVDKSCSPESEARMRYVIETQKGVLGVDSLKTRVFGTRYYVDVEIAADGNLTLREGHEIAERVHEAIENQFDMVKHCMVHVNPR